jgi:hypothetical protein
MVAGMEAEIALPVFFRTLLTNHQYRKYMMSHDVKDNKR